MCLEILTVFCFCSAKQRCCLCIPSKHAHYVMALTDFIELVLTGAACLWVYQSARNWHYENTGEPARTFLNNFYPYGTGAKVYKPP